MLSLSTSLPCSISDHYVSPPSAVFRIISYINMEDDRTRKEHGVEFDISGKITFFAKGIRAYKTNTNWYITYIDIKMVDELS